MPPGSDGWRGPRASTADVGADRSLVAHRRLADRLDRSRRRGFIGREREVERFRDLRAPVEPPCAVLFVHGPGGIGKTALLHELAAVARDGGTPVTHLDLRTIDPSPRDFLAAVGTGLDGDDDAPPHVVAGTIEERGVLLLDSYEAAAPLHAWLRDRFLPTLPAGALTVVASRARPGPLWREEPGWRELVREMELDGLEAEDAHRYLDREGVPPARRDRLVALARGHPLALSLLADAGRRTAEDPTADLADLADLPDVVGPLVARLVSAVPEEAHRRALQVCAHSRATTESLLRAVVGADDAPALFAWLRDLPIVEEGPEGLLPHDLARDVIEADLRWRDPDGFAEIHRRLRAVAVERVRARHGEPQLRACADVVFLHRASPRAAPYLRWTRAGDAYLDRLRTGDHGALLRMAARHEGDESADLVAHWLDRQPEAFTVFRRAAPQPIGFLAALALHRASDADLAADPGTRAMWGHVMRTAPPDPGDEVMAFRFLVDERAHQGPSTSFDLMGVRCVQHIVLQDRLAWDLGAFADPDAVGPFFTELDYHRVDADFDVGGHAYGVFAHDFRRVPAADWLDLTARHETQEGGDPPTARTGPGLSRVEVADAVRLALRDLHRPGQLAGNPLVGARVVAHRDGGPPAAVLAALVHDAAASLATDPRDEKLHRAVDRTFLRPAATQEAAAELLGLPFSTYRRHLTRGVRRIVDWIWERELHGEASRGPAAT